MLEKGRVEELCVLENNVENIKYSNNTHSKMPLS